MSDEIKFVGSSKIDGRQKITIIIKKNGEKILYDFIMEDGVAIKPSWRKHFTFDDLRTIQARAHVMRRYFIQSKPSEPEEQ